jgi:hypothetical protein
MKTAKEPSERDGCFKRDKALQGFLWNVMKRENYPGKDANQKR